MSWMSGAAAVAVVGIVGSAVVLTGDHRLTGEPGALATVRSEPGEWIVFEHFGQEPDGSTTEMDFARRQIWLTRPDGSDLHELAPGLPADGKSSPDVSPDGSKVAFSTWDPLVLLYEVGIEGEGPTLLSTDCSGLIEECQEWDPAWSPDGRRIAFVSLGVDGGGAFNEIAVRDLASGATTHLEETRVAYDEAWLNQPTWSPDGTQIAYHIAVDAGEGRYPGPTTIWIAEVDGSGARQLATPATVVAAADPDWSPDGSRIVYSTVGFRESEGAPPGTPPDRIFTIAPDGTDNQLVCSPADPVEAVRPGGCWAPSWMPGGEEILYWGNQTFNLMSADGSNKRQVDPEDRLYWFGDLLGYGYSAIWQPRLVEDPS